MARAGGCIVVSFAAWCLGALAASTLLAQDGGRQLRVFVVGGRDEPGTRELVQALRAGGLLAHVVERRHCAPDRLRAADVVLVHWPADLPFGDRAPLGPLERWDRPTVFVGDAGDRFAAAWGLPTLAELAGVPAAARSPEVQHWQAADAAIAIWRQGHLFHFGAAVDGALAEGKRTWLVRTVRHAARFQSDRPIVRTSGVDAADAARRARIDEACQDLGFDPGAPRASLQLVDRMAGADAGRIGALLDDLLPGACPPGTGQAGWMNWLLPRADQLVWDAPSRLWRVDPLALSRRVPLEDCRGDARADGVAREAAAVALAAKVVQHHGGRAFGDLHSFSCWRGDVYCLWDRAGGWFRLENHAQGPASWTIALFDTALGADVPLAVAARARAVSARDAFQLVVERVFLPCLLLEPGVSLRRCREQDAGPLQAIAVRLPWRGLDATAELVLLVDPASGAMHVATRHARGEVVRLLHDAAARVPCGLLSLPAEWTDDKGLPLFTITDPLWNPDLPAGLSTSPDLLGRPR